MSRYFETKLEVPSKHYEPTKPASSKLLRIKKRKQITDQNRSLAKTLRVANSKIKSTTETENPIVDEKRKKFYSRGDGLNDLKKVKTTFFKKKLAAKEKNIEWASEQSARAELLLTEESG